MDGFDIACLGRMEYKMDTKDRVLCPQFFREKLGEETSVYLVINAQAKVCDRCLLCMTEEKFRNYYEKLMKIPQNSSAHKLAKHIITNVAKVNVDSQYKILIPQHLKRYAGMMNETQEGCMVTAVWADDVLELWSTSRLDEKQEKDFADEEAAMTLEKNVNNSISEETIDYDDKEAVEKLRNRYKTMIEIDTYRAQHKELLLKMAKLEEEANGR